MNSESIKILLYLSMIILAVVVALYYLIGGTIIIVELIRSKKQPIPIERNIPITESKPMTNDEYISRLHTYIKLQEKKLNDAKVVMMNYLEGECKTKYEVGDIVEYIGTGYYSKMQGIIIEKVDIADNPIIHIRFVNGDIKILPYYLFTIVKKEGK